MESNQSPSIDPRILNLSYSSLLDLHRCPRYFELNKRNSNTISGLDVYDNLTFAFGHLVGDGVAKIFEGTRSIGQIFWESFLSWPKEVELNIENEKQEKSYWLGLLALEKFAGIRAAGFLNDYELVYYKNKEGFDVPAVELSFLIEMPDGFKFRGFVDVVLRHKISGKIVVIECKTSSDRQQNPATYKNSAQAIGYSVVLDTLFPGITSYEVKYVVYYTHAKEWNVLSFEKSYTQRALWIKELLLDIEVIKMYEREQVYPMHGESCRAWNRDCSYLGLCTMSNAFLTKPITQEELQEVEKKNAEYQIRLNLKDLLINQLRST